MRLSPVLVAAAIANAYGFAALTQLPAASAAPARSRLLAARQTAASLSGTVSVSQQSVTAGTSRSQPKPLALPNLKLSPKTIAQTPESTPQPTPATPLPSTQPLPETPSQSQPPADSDTTIPRPAPTEESTPDVAPTTPSSPSIIRPPGTQSAPQQETPNQIKVPIDGTPPTSPSPTPAPTDESAPAPPPGTEPSPEATPAPVPGTPDTPAPAETQPAPTEAPPEARVLVAEVVVRGETVELPPELQNEVYNAIRTQPGQTATRSQLQEDINAIFATGFFSNVRAEPEDTPLGVRVSYVVQPNPVLQNVRVEANPGTDVPSVLPPKIVDDIFRNQYGSILNFRRLQAGIKELNQWYQKNGYVLAQVVQAPQVSPDGTVTLNVAEGVVEDIQVRFVREGEATDDEGELIEGRTRDFIVKRELELEPGNVFNRNVVQRDLQRVYGLGLFEDVQVSLNPGKDPRQAVVIVNVDERSSGNVAAGLGFSSDSGIFGSVSYQEQNLGGNDQNLAAEVQIGEQAFLLFDLRFTDPWIAGDPYRTSYTINGFRRRTISLIFDGEDDNDIEVPEDDDDDDGDRPRVLRTGGGINFTRPLSPNPLVKSEWTASAGLQYQRVSIRNADGDIEPIGRFDGEEIQLSESEDGTDDLVTVQLGAVRDLRNNPQQPTSGSLLRFGVEQSVPIGSGNILLSRLRASYSQYVPINFTSFAEGPEALAFNVQAGTILGDLPPYEAFSLGGVNSVRGYDEGDLASGRSFVQATAEYRFPLFSVIGGALFFDVGSDLGSGSAVPGNPAGLLDKPGSGFGYGVGIRVNSPLGPLRLDYGLNDEGDSRLHFGFGERF